VPAGTPHGLAIQGKVALTVRADQEIDHMSQQRAFKAFDFPDPCNQMVAMLPFLALLTAVVAWSLSRSELFG
jgi:hypothetical protein